MMRPPEGRDDPHQRHLLVAAEGGDVRAMVLLADHLHRSDRTAQAEPWARAAAETGDPAAMHALAGVCTTMALGGRFPTTSARLKDHRGDPDREREFARWSEEGRRWRLKAAEAGNTDAISILSSTASSADERERWIRHAAAAGHSGFRAELLRILRRDGRFEEAEPWQRAAAEAGDDHEQLLLAEYLLEQGRTDEALPWFRTAADSASEWTSRSAAQRLADHFTAQGHLGEAEYWLRRIADSGRLGGPYDAARKLVRLLTDQGRDAEAEHWLAQLANSDDDRLQTSEAAEELARRRTTQGREAEAARWRRRAHEIRSLPPRPRPSLSMPSMAMAEVALTALVSTAVLPFVQTLVTKAAEDAYAQARELIRRLPLRRSASPDATDDAHYYQPRPKPAEFVVIDDPEADITLYLSSEASDEALRALAALDLDDLTSRRPDEGRIRLVWHAASGTWRIRGEAPPPPRM
ncbi:MULTISPECIES: hypothetical protein [unclassified Streptomyces]|uniref:tetratricopeptide repeat protein n=1 Tax=unclassified Streptomyces TaxID=2593676 RepID=UPI00278BD435|nr:MULTISPECIES: hypothetical protein [unclassified Streptomyces]